MFRSAQPLSSMQQKQTTVELFCSGMALPVSLAAFQVSGKQHCDSLLEFKKQLPIMCCVTFMIHENYHRIQLSHGKESKWQKEGQIQFILSKKKKKSIFPPHLKSRKGNYQERGITGGAVREHHREQLSFSIGHRMLKNSISTDGFVLRVNKSSHFEIYQDTKKDPLSTTVYKNNHHHHHCKYRLC